MRNVASIRLTTRNAVITQGDRKDELVGTIYEDRAVPIHTIELVEFG